MIVVLDTDHLTVVQRKSEPAYSNLSRHLTDGSDRDVRASIISFEEQMRGWLSLISRARSPAQEVASYERLEALQEFFSKIPILNYDLKAAEHFARLRRLRLPVGTMDLRIAAITISVGGILLTRNTKDFGRVPNLSIDDWTK
ncbi:MAG TPA: type II toxin-antitoxin system VapC family toxin [Blastocatellia bacterium]|nr:type II toxin-antitoxin system VapC family toxin [Blastocatellia bacterium]